MNFESAIRRLGQLESKLQKLLEENALLYQEVYKLQNENKDLNNKIESQNADLKNFQNQHKISKIASSVTVGEGTGDGGLKRKINEYIKEIDQCIAHLSEK